MEGRTAYRQHMTVFWLRAQHHVTTSLMKLAIGERNVATNLGTISGCVTEYCFSIIIVIDMLLRKLQANNRSTYNYSDLITTSLLETVSKKRTSQW